MWTKKRPRLIAGTFYTCLSPAWFVFTLEGEPRP